MTYYIARGGAQLGTFPEAEIREGLSSGTFLTTDLAWKEGMDNWKSVGEVFEIGLGGSDVSPPQPSPGVASPQPVASPSPTASVIMPTASTPGLAIAALVLGIVSLCTCGGFGIGALAAIICGHMAMSKINGSQGALVGRGKALTGAVLGYLSLLAVVAWLVFSVFAGKRVLNDARTFQTLSNGKQLVTACLSYASDNEGKLPDSLEQLAPRYVLDSELQRLTINPKGGPFFEYLGNGKTMGEPGDTVILLGTHINSQGGRTVGRLNGVVEAEVYSP